MKLRSIGFAIMLCVVSIGANVTVRAAAGKDEVKRVGAVDHRPERDDGRG